MALSKEEKEALNDHYMNNDLYDPSKAPEQEVVSYRPKGFCEGGMTVGYDKGGMVAETDFKSMKDLLKQKPTHKGMVDGIEEHYSKGGQVKGYDDGGSVQLTGFDSPDPYSFTPTSGDPDSSSIPDQAISDMASDFVDVSKPARGKTPVQESGPSSFDGPSLSDDTQTARGSTRLPDFATEGFSASLPLQTPKPIAAPAKIASASAAPKLPLPGSSGQPAPAAESPIKTLEPDQYAQLIAALNKRPSIGQSAMSGLAGLADAIETGVARSGNPGFQKGIDERAQSQKQNLIEALRGKYEAGFKNKELGQSAQKITEEGRHNKASEDIGKSGSAARIGEAANQAQINALEGMGRLSQSGGVFGYKNTPETAQAIQALAQRAGLAGGGGKVPTITTKAEYDALPKGTHYQDARGKQGIKK